MKDTKEKSIVYIPIQMHKVHENSVSSKKIQVSNVTIMVPRDIKGFMNDSTPWNEEVEFKLVPFRNQLHNQLNILCNSCYNKNSE